MICIIFYTNLVASFHIDEVMFMGNKGIQLSAKTLVPDKNFCNQSYMGFAQVERDIIPSVTRKHRAISSLF